MPELPRSSSFGHGLALNRMQVSDAASAAVSRDAAVVTFESGGGTPGRPYDNIPSTLHNGTSSIYSASLPSPSLSPLHPSSHHSASYFAAATSPSSSFTAPLLIKKRLPPNLRSVSAPVTRYTTPEPLRVMREVKPQLESSPTAASKKKLISPSSLFRTNKSSKTSDSWSSSTSFFPAPPDPSLPSFYHLETTRSAPQKSISHPAPSTLHKSKGSRSISSSGSMPSSPSFLHTPPIAIHTAIWPTTQHTGQARLGTVPVSIDEMDELVLRMQRRGSAAGRRSINRGGGEVEQIRRLVKERPAEKKVNEVIEAATPKIDARITTAVLLDSSFLATPLPTLALSPAVRSPVETTTSFTLPTLASSTSLASSSSNASFLSFAPSTPTPSTSKQDLHLRAMSSAITAPQEVREEAQETLESMIRRYKLETSQAGGSAVLSRAEPLPSFGSTASTPTLSPPSSGGPSTPSKVARSPPVPPKSEMAKGRIRNINDVLIERRAGMSGSSALIGSTAPPTPAQMVIMAARGEIVPEAAMDDLEWKDHGRHRSLSTNSIGEDSPAIAAMLIVSPSVSTSDFKPRRRRQESCEVLTDAGTREGSKIATSRSKSSISSYLNFSLHTLPLDPPSLYPPSQSSLISARKLTSHPLPDGLLSVQKTLAPC